MKRVVFKCAFGGENGWGHVVRCSALAAAFKNNGWETCLWGGGDSDLLPSEVHSAFVRLDASGSTKADVLCIDEMYTEQSSFDELLARWRRLNGSGVVLGIDDMQVRSMAGFDLVLNTEIALREASYRSLKALLGERYALLRSGFGAPENTADLPQMWEGSVPVLVMIGGTDPFGFTERVLEGLAEMGSDRFLPIVVSSEPKAMVDTLARFRAYRVLSRLGSAEVAAWMGFCRIGVIACGSTLYEASGMGLPFVGLSVVDNQTATARKVRTEWGMPVLNCEKGSLDPLALQSGVETVLSRARRPYSEVDTKGAERVFRELEILCG
ncbi:hypothetical protein [Pelagicoccus mobilis]|uniref:Uncharacterized protein n=1 Tax=Pelagicoccus mobilis TaxID=415221 RepID=A0A934VSI6_9BACT|nr:hypothetical protein [Pelagicoccus mobilis]MBK1880462.1 hypothetical protein [Pelagicoccus mobilis]